MLPRVFGGVPLLYYAKINITSCDSQTRKKLAAAIDKNRCR